MLPELSSLKLKDVPDGVASRLLRAWRILYRLAPSIEEEIKEPDFLLFRFWFTSALGSCEQSLYQYLKHYGYEQEL